MVKIFMTVSRHEGLYYYNQDGKQRPDQQRLAELEDTATHTGKPSKTGRVHRRETCRQPTQLTTHPTLTIGG